MRVLPLLLMGLLGLGACTDGEKEDTSSEDTNPTIIDADSDGFEAAEDCDDTNAAVHPNATESCNTIDDNCDGAIDEAGATGESAFYADGDNDGFGDTASTMTACTAPDGYVADDGDCDDANGAVSPGATEVCDAADVDEDCDGMADSLDDSTVGRMTWYSDVDLDTYGDATTAVTGCDLPEGSVTVAEDCDDTNAAVNPGAVELCDDADADENCNGMADDLDAGVSGQHTAYTDADADGYGDMAAEGVMTCETAGLAFTNDDCNDADAAVSPGAAEVCDDADLDENCNALADDADAGVTGGTAWYMDADGDGLGDPAMMLEACAAPEGYVADGTDTDDGGTETVYDALGGAAAIDAVLDQFLANVAADSSINWMFARADLDRLKTLLAEQICEATGGGCVYTGGDMATVHAEMRITNDQFDALVADLLAALDTLAVPYTPGTFDGGLPADTLILALAAMQTQIVTDADGDLFYFNQLGGHPALEAIVDEFIANVGADSRINGYFASSDLASLNDRLVEQMCDATDGYCEYSGLSMCDAHAGMGLTEDDFDALVEDLLMALDTLGVPYALDGTESVDGLLLTLVGMEGEILGTDCDTTETVYDALGGEAAIDAVLDQFLANVAADSTINWMFADADLEHLHTMLAEQICEATGGGCTYTGGDMATVHADMAITDTQFNALVGDLLAALDSLGVPYTSGTFDGGLPADTLILALAAMQPDIVTDADGTLVTFNQIGGHAAVEAVIDQFLVNVAADARINGFFATTDLVTLDALLVEQVCETAGGYCAYSGRSMCEVHAGMGIAEADFTAMVEDMLAALDTLGVPYALDGSEAIDPVLIALVGLQGQIVEPMADCE